MLCSALTRTFHRSTFQRYRNVYHHKQTKNQWARDDPAMVVLIALALALVGTLWSYVHGLTASQTAITVLFMVFRDFLLASAAIATILWCALFDPLAKRPDLLSANPDLRLRPLSASGSSPTSCCCRLAHIRLRRIRASSGPLRLTSPSTPSSPSFSGFTSGSCFSSDSSRAGRSSLASCLNGAIADRSRTLLSPRAATGSAFGSATHYTCSRVLSTSISRTLATRRCRSCSAQSFFWHRCCRSLSAMSYRCVS